MSPSITKTLWSQHGYDIGYNDHMLGAISDSS